MISAIPGNTPAGQLDACRLKLEVRSLVGTTVLRACFGFILALSCVCISDAWAADFNAASPEHRPALSAQSLTNAADLFKDFVENPPAITCLSYAVVRKDGSQPVYCKVRTQSNAFIYARDIPKQDSLLPSLYSCMPTEAYSACEDRYWRLIGPMLSVWVDNGFTNQATTEFKASFGSPRHHVHDITSMGLSGHFEWGTDRFRWQGDNFDFTNSTGYRLKGQLTRDGLMRAGQIVFTIGVPHSTNAPKWVVSYEYDKDKPLSLAYLPNRIRRETYLGGRSFPIEDFAVFAIDTSADSLPPESFEEGPFFASLHPSVFIQTNLLIGNTYYFASSKSRQFYPLPIQPTPRGGVFALVFRFWSALQSGKLGADWVVRGLSVGGLATLVVVWILYRRGK